MTLHVGKGLGLATTARKLRVTSQLCQRRDREIAASQEPGADPTPEQTFYTSLPRVRPRMRGGTGKYSGGLCVTVGGGTGFRSVLVP